MLNPSASLAMSTSVLEALPGKLDIKKHSPSIFNTMWFMNHKRFDDLPTTGRTDTQPSRVNQKRMLRMPVVRQ